MSRTLFNSIVIFATLAATAGCSKQHAVMAGQTDVRTFKPPIHINVTCADSTTIALVDDKDQQAWTYWLKKNEDIEWVGGAAVDSFTIKPKPGDAWPLDNMPPLQGDKQQAKQAKAKAKGDAADGAHGYIITAYCSSANVQHKVVIDPDMMIFSSLQ